MFTPPRKTAFRGRVLLVGRWIGARRIWSASKNSPATSPPSGPKVRHPGRSRVPRGGGSEKNAHHECGDDGLVSGGRDISPAAGNPLIPANGQQSLSSAWCGVYGYFRASLRGLPRDRRDQV
jgi:hypothetical protein